MKIALLTFHNAANYGAALQAFALQKALDEKGFKNEYINYQNKHRINSYSISYFIIGSIKKGDFRGTFRYLLGSPFLLLRKLRFKAFYKKNLRSTEKIFSNSTESEILNSDYDKFIVGSDQVWNWSNNGGDHSYLLSFVHDNSKKISYSSSFGLAIIPENLENTYQKYLNQFNHLSVREQYGVDLVKNLTGRVPELVLDPVYLLSRDYWLKIAKPKIPKSKFIFSYTNKPNQLENFLSTTKLTLIDTKIYKLSRNINITDFLDKNVRVKYSISPSKFISVIRDAELVVSASFHCISMAIILNKPFVAILTGNKGKDERILNILNLLNLKHRIYNDKMTEEEVNNPINYSDINEKINKLRLMSFKYLLKTLKD